MIARVLPDLPAVDKAFDYLVPDDLRDQVRVGTIVRVDLHGRRVRGWVVDVPDEPAPGVDPKPLAKVSSAGPPEEVVGLARWAAWRWAGRWAHLLRTASPAANVPPHLHPVRIPVGERASQAGLIEVVQLPPAADRLALVRDAVASGATIVVVPEVDAARRLADRLRRDGHRIALLAGEMRPDQWALAASGRASVVGTRIAVWAPITETHLRRIIVLDEHDEALQSEQAPTWHARDVAAERWLRTAAPCTLVSPVPTLHARALAQEVRITFHGWPPVELVDRRRDGVPGLFSRRFAALVREGGRVVCVLNRLGRSRLLVCTACDTTAACERCGAAAHQPDLDVLRCGACGAERPPVCADCGGGRFKNLRMGVARAAEELAALVGEPVAEVTADGGDPAAARVAIGTEAVLRRLPARSVDVVAFLDVDQELLAPRYRAGEHALALLARAARAVRPGGRVLAQTRLPDHPVLQAAAAGDPRRFTDGEAERRKALGYPPFGALAVVSGAAAEAWAAAATAVPPPLGVEVLGPADGRWLVRAPDPDALAGFLAGVERPTGRLRIEVDPPRV